MNKKNCINISRLLCVVIVLCILVISQFTINAFADNSSLNYLAFTAVDGDVDISFQTNSFSNKNVCLQYCKSLNTLDWTDISFSSSLTITKDETVYFKVKEKADTFGWQFVMQATGDKKGRIKASGAVTSLLDPACQSDKVGAYAFNNLFYGCTTLIEAPDLPAMTLASGCYTNMFYNCSELKKAPDLPAQTLANYCYSGMFRYCSGLTTAPDLPAQTLANYCYNNMFSSCWELETAPKLPAKTLASYCYYNMFYDCKKLAAASEMSAETLASHCCMGMYSGCSKLKKVPDLPAVNLAEYCYDDMFANCTNILEMPNLPAETLKRNCYSYMFTGCKKLTSVKDLPAKTLAIECYKQMFSGCSELTNAPKICAQTLDNSCCNGMFWDCTKLTYVPDLTAETLAINCYSSMFYGCTSLVTAPKIYAKQLAESCCVEMFSNCKELKNAPELPAQKMEKNCYARMFYCCTKLETAPSLPSENLANSCYSYMFYFCNNLKNPPELPAEQLFSNCYSYMFSYCYELEKAPELSAKTLADSCYAAMFSYCKKLIKAPELPADTLFNSCYNNMFAGCVALEKAPKLDATNLANSCYNQMFNGCTSLVTAPELPATNLEVGCYSNMFIGCSKLKAAPKLQATTLKSSCYTNMFAGCTELESAPELPATTLAANCYTYMFSGCNKLSTAPVLPAPVLTNNCYQNMFLGCTNISEVTIYCNENYNINNAVSGFITNVAKNGTVYCTPAVLEDEKFYLPEGWKKVLLCEKYEHDFEEDKLNEEKPHTYKCKICGYKDYREHTYDAFKDNGDGTHVRICKECGSKETKSHDFSGDEYFACENGTHYKKCLDCESESEPEKCVWDDGIIIKEPTQELDGEKEYTCNLCGNKKTEKIPKLEPTPTPNPTPNPGPEPNPTPNNDPDLNPNSDPGPNKEIHITFDANGGRCDKQEMTITLGEEPGNMPTASKKNVIFAGWVDKSGNSISDLKELKEDTVLVASWQNITLVAKQKMNVTSYFADAKDEYINAKKMEAQKAGKTFDEKTVKTRIKVLKASDYEKVKSMNSVSNNALYGKASVNAKGILSCKKSGIVAVSLQFMEKTGKKTTWVSSQDILFVAIEKISVDKKVIKDLSTLNYIGKTVSINGIIKYEGEDKIGNLPNVAEYIVSTNKNEVVSVNTENGEIKALKNGKAKITVMYKMLIGDSKYSTVKVSFNVKVKIPEFKKNAVSVKAGKLAKLSLKNVSKKTAVKWSSSNEAVATVENGKVKGITAGTAIITANVDGIDYTCRVTVE